jgi:hypothetical protein
MNENNGLGGSFPNCLSPTTVPKGDSEANSFACVDLPAPAPPTSLGAMESGGEPGPSAGSPCIAVG